MVIIRSSGHGAAVTGQTHDCKQPLRCPPNDLGRREFIAFIGGTAVAWPLAARAQQPERMRRIGVPMNTGADESESQARLAAFMQGFQELGLGRRAQ